MRGSTILIVEGDADMRGAIAEVLKREGLGVLATDDGRTALELMETCRPSLVLLDPELLGMSGKEFLQAQRQRPGVARTPVIVMAGEPAAAELGDAVLAKPFGIEELLAVVTRFVGAPRALREPVP